MGDGRTLLRDLPRLALLSLLGLIILSPYIWMLSASLKPTDEIFRANLALIPERFAAVENYSRVFAQVPVGRYLLNGVIVQSGNDAALTLVRRLAALR
mgnify:CR=1 FL=1